jgi:2-furoyl-CoA dehydrogenase large subunit
VLTGEGHALQGKGETIVPAPIEEVWETLLDPEKLAGVIPGCHALDLVAENSYRAEVSLGVGPVRGKFTAAVRLSDLDPPRSARLSGELVGPMGSSRGGGVVALESIDGGATKVNYSYEVELSGKVAAVGGRMLEGATRIVIGQFFERLVAQVGGPSASVPWWRKLLRMLGVGQ